jgi:hypothetical protein
MDEVYGTPEDVSTQIEVLKEAGMQPFSSY